MLLIMMIRQVPGSWCLNMIVVFVIFILLLSWLAFHSHPHIHIFQLDIILLEVLFYT